MEDVIELRAPVFTEPPYSALVADVYETSAGDAYVIEIRVPGLKPDEIDVQVDPYSVKVSTKPAPTNADAGRRYIVREHSARPMWRRFDFPVEIDKDNVKANLEYGMLRIVVPKQAAGKRKTIAIEQAA
jgi:HSP20 family protein